MSRHGQTERMEKATEKVTQEMMDAIIAISKDGRVACEPARKLAEDLGISKTLMGAAADKAGLKVVDCGLGCF